MSFFDWLIIVIAKVVSFAIRILGLGAGATWPGEIALRCNAHILEVLAKKHGNIVLVAGTNGKTTTAKMIETILMHAGKKVRINGSGANLDNGIISCLIEDLDFLGNYRSTVMIFEVDEATLPNIMSATEPRIVVLLNLFRDQLDRYGEVDIIAGKWKESLLNVNPKKTTLIVNGDDPHLSYLGSLLHGHVSYFGLDDPSLYRESMDHATDTIYCPACGNRLTFGGVYFSHLGKWACGRCGLTHPNLTMSAKDVASPIPGVYNIYNTLAATLVASHFHVSIEESTSALAAFEPAFGRMERVTYQGKEVVILLSKNPTGFNESLRAVVSAGAGHILLVLNDRIADGTDVSWIWDVDFEQIPRSVRVIVSGDRALDLAVRMKYTCQAMPLRDGVDSSDNNSLTVYEDLDTAIQCALSLLPAQKTLYVLPTYSAMLEVRKILTGKKIL